MTYAIFKTRERESAQTREHTVGNDRYYLYIDTYFLSRVSHETLCIIHGITAAFG